MTNFCLTECQNFEEWWFKIVNLNASARDLNTMHKYSESLQRQRRNKNGTTGIFHCPSTHVSGKAPVSFKQTQFRFKE